MYNSEEKTLVFHLKNTEQKTEQLNRREGPQMYLLYDRVDNENLLNTFK